MLVYLYNFSAFGKWLDYLQARVLHILENRIAGLSLQTNGEQIE